MRASGGIIGICLLTIGGCPAPKPVVLMPPPRDAGIETPVPEVDLREAHQWPWPGARNPIRGNLQRDPRLILRVHVIA